MSIKLSDKKLLVSIILALITTFGVSITVYATGTESTNTVSEEIFNHVESLNPHPGTSVELKYITEGLDENTKEIKKLRQAVCSHSDFNCQD